MDAFGIDELGIELLGGWAFVLSWNVVVGAQLAMTSESTPDADQGAIARKLQSTLRYLCASARLREADRVLAWTA